MSNRWWRFAILVALLAAGAWLLVDLISPPTELTRLRNSLIASEGHLGDFDWRPDAIPKDFASERLPPPPPFEDIPSTLGISQDADAVTTMQALVKHLRAKPKKRGPIQSSTIETYREITSTGRGYCADYTQVFNALAHATGLPVREWGMSFDGYGGDGHAFNEVYDVRSGHWIFVDPMNAFFVRDDETGRPLSVVELMQRLESQAAMESMRVVPIADRFLFKDASSALQYYEQGSDEFFLWYGNDVFSYDSHPVVAFLGRWSRSLEQLAAIMLGVHPKLRVYPTEGSADRLDSLFQFRAFVFLLTFVLAILAILAALELRLLLKDRRSVSRPS